MGVNGLGIAEPTEAMGVLVGLEVPMPGLAHGSGWKSSGRKLELP